MSGYTHHGDCSTSDPCKRCFQFGQTTEQKRIIKLLEEHKCIEPVTHPWECYCEGVQFAIALIKGEQNG